MRWPCTAVEIVDGRPQRATPARWVYGVESVATRIAVVLWTLRGQWPDDVTLGLDLWDWTLPSTPSTVIEGVVRAQLLRIAGVVRVLDVVATRPGTELHIGAVCEVSTGTSGETVTIAAGSVADIWQGFAPGTWYTVLQVGVRPVRIGSP